MSPFNNTEIPIRPLSKKFLRINKSIFLHFPLTLALATSQFSYSGETDKSADDELVRTNAVSVSKMVVSESSLMDSEGYMITSKQLGKSIFRRSVGFVETITGDVKQKIPSTELELAVNSKDVYQMARDNPNRFRIDDEEQELVGVERLGFITMKNALAGLIYMKKSGKTGCERLPMDYDDFQFWHEVSPDIKMESNPGSCSLSFKIRVLENTNPETGRTTFKATGELCRYPSAKILDKDSQVCVVVLPDEDLGARTYLFTKRHEDRLVKRVVKDAEAAAETKGSFTDRYFTYPVFFKREFDDKKDPRVFAGKVNDIFGAFLPEFRAVTGNFLGNWAGLSSKYVKEARSAKFKEQMVFAMAEPEKLEEAAGKKEKDPKYNLDLQEAGIESIHAHYYLATTKYNEETDQDEEYYSDDHDFSFEMSASSMTLKSPGITITFTPINVSKGALAFADSDENTAALSACQLELKDSRDDTRKAASQMAKCQRDYVATKRSLEQISEDLKDLASLGSSTRERSPEQQKHLDEARILTLIDLTNAGFAKVNKLLTAANPDLKDSELYMGGKSIAADLTSKELWSYHDSLPLDSEENEPYTVHVENDDENVAVEEEDNQNELENGLK